MSWSPQQDAALKKVGAWLKDKKAPQVFRLFGFAGTGKTTLAIEIAKMAKGRVLFGAYTGKAALMMQKKGCKNASTIHSMIYKPLDDGTFALNRDSDVRTAALVIIDEVSMVNEEMGKDLLSFGTRVLVLGDPAQLPPITGTGFFTAYAPHVMLTEIHRQAADNPIIHLATRAREEKRIAKGHYGSSTVFDRKWLTQGDIKRADQVIAGMNRTRISSNDRIRKMRGIEGIYPVIGEKLVCLKNFKDPKQLNGSIWTVDDHPEISDGMVHMRLISEDGLPTHDAEVAVEFFEGTEDTLDKYERRYMQEFTFGYTLTCHKAQGSQWDNIVVFNEATVFKQDRHRWLYTAITRAAESLILVNGD